MDATTAAPRTPRGELGASGVLVPGPYHAPGGYTDRATKARYIARKYAAILGGRVLDVGCDEAPLRGLVGDPGAYVGVDLNPAADVRVNLDRDAREDGTILPFPGASFDTVVCTDVLEHLERAHAVFDELCRVSCDRVIVSLPNPIAAFLEGLASGSGGRIKYYGLPAEAPADRHRWFFGFEEAAAFVRDRGARRGFEIEQLDAEKHGAMERLAREPGIGALVDHPNVRHGTMWCVLRRARG